MRGETSTQSELFSYVNLESRIPADCSLLLHSLIAAQRTNMLNLDLRDDSYKTQERK